MARRNGSVTRDLIISGPGESAIEIPGRVSATGLELRSGLPFGSWTQVGQTLARMDAAYRWWLGDWLNYGEQAYGNGYQEAIAATGLDYESCRACRWVAESIEFVRRRPKLSWSHHEEVAGLTPDEQDEWLARAEANGWTQKELRAWLKGSKPKPLPTHTPLLRFCQNLPTPIIVAQILRVYFPDAETAFDATGGDGGFWDGSEPVQVTALYVDPARSNGGPGDFRHLAYVDGSFDVALIDPPHLADGGRDSIMTQRFGTYEDAELEDVIRDGCREAWRVARLGIIVKVTDHVHGQRYVLESDWVRSAIGEEPFDEVYQVRTDAVIDPKWEEQLSAYNNGSTYLIFRHDGPLHKRR
jgi:hypothetical protein